MKGITKEALDWLEHNQYCDSIGMEHVRRLIVISLPPDLAAKWRDRTRGGYEFELLKCQDSTGELFGVVKLSAYQYVAAHWLSDGVDYSGGVAYSLIPRSKHSELIETARGHAQALRNTDDGRFADLIDQLITALEQEGQ